MQSEFFNVYLKRLILERTNLSSEENLLLWIEVAWTVCAEKVLQL